MRKVIKVGSRNSRLALAQVDIITKLLQNIAPEVEVELVEISTTGDKFLGDLSKAGGKGAFVKEIEHALLDKSIDMAVHCMKDVPNDLPDGLIIPCMPKRGDLRDVALCREGFSFETLPQGAKVGTSSLRRTSQLRRNFPHLDMVPIRGNIDTRIKKMNNGDVDAIILARVGLVRVGWENKADVVFEPDMMLPPVGQGALGVECRADDTEMRTLLDQINDKDTFACVTAERAMTRLLGGNCHTPIAGYCEVTKGGSLRMIAHVASPDGRTLVRARNKMPYDNPEALGESIAQELLTGGAGDIIDALNAKAS